MTILSIEVDCWARRIARIDVYREFDNSQYMCTDIHWVQSRLTIVRMYLELTIVHMYLKLTIVHVYLELTVVHVYLELLRVETDDVQHDHADFRRQVGFHVCAEHAVRLHRKL